MCRVARGPQPAPTILRLRARAHTHICRRLAKLSSGHRSRNRWAAVSEARKDARQGVLCHLGGLLPGGARVVVVWKAWASGAERESLRWELRRIVPDLGWTETHHTPLHKHLQVVIAQVSGLASHVGWDSTTIVGKSRQALVSSGANEALLEDAEAVAWVSTAGLLMLLANCYERKRAIADRQKAGLIAKLLLESCVHADAVGADARVPQPSTAVLCQKEPVESGLCSCAQKALAKGIMPDPAGASPQAFAFEVLLHAFRARSCDALKRWTRDLAEQLAAQIDAHVANWGDFEWHRSSAAVLQSRARPRRVDPHARAYVLSEGVRQGQVATVGQAANSMHSVDGSTAVKWREGEMCAYRACCMLALRSSPILCLAFDAARVGRPAKDILVAVLSAPLENRHCVLPPQVSCGCVPTAPYGRGVEGKGGW